MKSEASVAKTDNNWLGNVAEVAKIIFLVSIN